MSLKMKRINYIMIFNFYHFNITINMKLEISSKINIENNLFKKYLNINLLMIEKIHFRIIPSYYFR
jgi:hypothetical protein